MLLGPSLSRFLLPYHASNFSLPKFEEILFSFYFPFFYSDDLVIIRAVQNRYVIFDRLAFLDVILTLAEPGFITLLRWGGSCQPFSVGVMSEGKCFFINSSLSLSLEYCSMNSYLSLRTSLISTASLVEFLYVSGRLLTFCFKVSA